MQFSQGKDEFDSIGCRLLILNTFADILPYDVSAYICAAEVFFVESYNHMISYTKFVSDKLSISHNGQLTLGEDAYSFGKIFSFLQMMRSQNNGSVLIFDGF